MTKTWKQLEKPKHNYGKVPSVKCLKVNFMIEKRLVLIHHML